MVGGDIQLFDEIFLTGTAAFGAAATTVLGTVLTQQGSFDIAQMRDGDNHF